MPVCVLHHNVSLVSFFLFLDDFIYLFFREGRRKSKRERNINVWLPLVLPLPGTWPTTQACTLDWKLNPWPFDSQAGTQPLSHTSQGFTGFLSHTPTTCEMFSVREVFRKIPIFVQEELRLSKYNKHMHTYTPFISIGPILCFLSVCK